MDVLQPAKHVESLAPDETSEAVENAIGQGIECGHGGSEHEQPTCKSEHVPLAERTDVVEIGKGHRPHSFRRCSEAGTSGSHAGSKTDGEQDQGTRGCLGPGALPDRTP